MCLFVWLVSAKNLFVAAGNTWRPSTTSSVGIKNFEGEKSCTAPK
jgi:hypothetical protein